MIPRPRGFWGGGLVCRSPPRAPDRGLSRLYSFLQPSFFKLVQVSHPKCRPKVASSATEQCCTAALLVADGGQRNRFQPLFPISRACKANHCCRGTTPPCHLVQTWRVTLILHRTTLRRHLVRRLQGFLQEEHPQTTWLPVQRQQGVRGYKACEEPLPILPAAEVPWNGDA